MKEEQRKRIERMESIFNEMGVALKNLEDTLGDWTEKMPLYDELLSYYTSEDWMIDYEDSKNSESFPGPEEMSQAILSEDAIYDEMVRYRELAIRLLKLATYMIEQ
ncbi:uncharacterized protein DUF4298 [Balneicella halophila]|uniref:Uncharacterized protein DUF4298 n=1 Tax=Balneicella halophila TaxID=1537566 RepID=A0A7L4UN35_BALHA|nr:DUF4298 domain-containing protein [Balneicella halophila]PVX50041.1 uncharacterized protein DUF4298 [Balneicella halophila]